MLARAVAPSDPPARGGTLRENGGRDLVSIGGKAKGTGEEITPSRRPGQTGNPACATAADQRVRMDFVSGPRATY